METYFINLKNFMTFLPDDDDLFKENQLKEMLKLIEDIQNE